MAIYQGMCSGENSIESTWALMGMATKLAQSIGLHRDCARWKLPPAEVQKRRALFWELFITDGWQSLATGRLATFSLPFVDCELPYDPNSTIADDGSVQPSFPFWKARFGAECVSAVQQGTLTSRAPKYSVILELDRIIRNMDLPKYALDPPAKNAGLSETMSHYMPHNYRHLTLLYVHRCFFAHAIASNPVDPIKGQYGPSFLAGYRSSCELLNGLKTQFSLFPAQMARFWVLWTHGFSSSVMLSSVVTHCSQSKVASAALVELRQACELFEKAASYGGRAVKFLPILKRLQQKAQQTFLDTHSGLPPAVRNDIFNSRQEEKKDELSIFSGQTHIVATKVNNTNPNRPQTQQSAVGRSPPLSDSSSPSSLTANISPTEAYASTNSLFAGVHPSLVAELHGFDGRLNAQIQHAYYVNHDALAGSILENQGYQLMQLQRSSLQQPQTQEVQSQPQARAQLPHQFQERPATYPVHVNVADSSQSVSSLPTAYNTQMQKTGGSIYPSQAIQSAAYEHDLHASAHNHSWQEPVSSVYSQVVPDASSHSTSQSWFNYPQLYVHQHAHQHLIQQQQMQTPPQQPPALQQLQGNYAATDYAYPPMTQQTYPAARPGAHYTPEAALHGFAAEDRSLQEHWTSFMYNVGSPRQFMDN